MSIFEAVLILVIMMDWQLKDFAGRTLSGDIYIPNGMYNGKMACLDMLFNGLKPDGTPNDLKQGIPLRYHHSILISEIKTRCSIIVSDPWIILNLIYFFQCWIQYWIWNTTMSERF